MSSIFNEYDALNDPGLREVIACWRKNARSIRKLHLLLEDHDNIIAYLNSHLTFDDMVRDLKDETPEYRREFLRYLMRYFPSEGDC